ncbi:hypothetical protein GCM10010294_35740 [Streptomyces griseoloalbus]|nr:hypothetical protein GCM10010294_35740 [Streptomyces griseoloalbus]
MVLCAGETTSNRPVQASGRDEFGRAGRKDRQTPVLLDGAEHVATATRTPLTGPQAVRLGPPAARNTPGCVGLVRVAKWLLRQTCCHS